MKLLLENWRKYLAESITDEEVQRVDRVLSTGENLDTLITEMTKIGFKSLLPRSVQTPIIVTFISPSDKKFKFNRFYNYLKNFI